MSEHLAAARGGRAPAVGGGAVEGGGGFLVVVTKDSVGLADTRSSDLKQVAGGAGIQDPTIKVDLRLELQVRVVGHLDRVFGREAVRRRARQRVAGKHMPEVEAVRSWL